MKCISRFRVLALACLGSMGPAYTMPAFAGNIVQTVVTAPVTYNGTVAGSPTEFVITLDRSLDPAVAGRSLMAGRSIRVTLPDAFTEVEALPVAAPFAVPECRTFPAVDEAPLQCNTAFLLQGWPQQPIAPPPVLHEKYTVTREGVTTLVVTAKEDIVAAPPDNPGIKQIHLALKGVVNPAEGDYRVAVAAETGPDGAVESGSGTLHIAASPTPAIALTSAFNPPPPFANTLYQRARPGGRTPLPYDLLLWDRDGEPLVGVELARPGGRAGELALLKRGEDTIGRIAVKAPSGATGQDIVVGTASTAVRAPVTGVPSARLTVGFEAGSRPGPYEVEFSLDGGNTVTTYVMVE